MENSEGIDYGCPIALQLIVREADKAREKVERLVFEDNILSKDKRVEIFSASGTDRTPRFSTHADPYWSRCLCCGTTARGEIGITRAHLVVNNRQKYSDTYDKWGRTAGFATDFVGESERNHVPLCGTLGALGTCHDAFDKDEMTLVYDPFTREYRIFWPANHKHHDKVVHPPATMAPYRRVLVWRARHFGLRKRNYELIRIANISNEAHASDAGSSSGPPSKKARVSHGGGSSGQQTDSWNRASRNHVTSEDFAEMQVLTQTCDIDPDIAANILQWIKSKSDEAPKVAFSLAPAVGSLGAKWDSRFPKNKGWSRTDLPDGRWVYYNSKMQVGRIIPRGG
jgi:hypothetical protein